MINFAGRAARLLRQRHLPRQRRRGNCDALMVDLTVRRGLPARSAVEATPVAPPQLRSVYRVAPRRPGADVVVLRGSHAALVRYEGTHAAPNSGIRLSSPQVIQRAKKEKENRYRDSNQVLTRLYA